MATSHKRVDGVFLTSSFTTADTVTGSGVRLTFAEVVFVNTDSVDHTIELRFVKSGQASDAKYTVAAPQADNVIPAGETRKYTYRPMLNVGDFIEWKADASGVVAASIGYILESG